MANFVWVSNLYQASSFDLRVPRRIPESESSSGVLPGPHFSIALVYIWGLSSYIQIVSFLSELIEQPKLQFSVFGGHSHFFLSIPFSCT